MRTEAIFVKPDDYFNFFGDNLYKKMMVKDNESNRVDLFLMYVEEAIMTNLDTLSFRLDKWDNLTPLQKECMQKAVLFQANYILRNGDMFSDSGYDPERGFVADPAKIQNAAICDLAKKELVKCGLWNHVILNRRRYPNWW